MDSALFTQIIAVIGCVTGVCSLVLNFYKLLSEKPKVKIEDYKFFLNGFCDNKNDGFRSKKILVLNLRINNVSLAPITLKNVIFKHDNITLWANYEYKFTGVSFSKGNTTSYYNVDKQIDFPFTIEPMKIVNCSLVFPFADDLFNLYVKNGSNPMSVCVNLLMNNKRVKFKTKIFELTEENIRNYQKNNKEKLYTM